jgi:hypothetical protein
MTFGVAPGGEADYNRVEFWLARATSNGANCFVCKSIAASRRGRADPIRPFKLGGIEMTPEAQIDHLVRCLGQWPEADGPPQTNG